MTSRPMIIWAVSDGRAGIENQVLGLADAVARLPRPRVAVLIGGKSRGFALSPTRARVMADEIEAAVRAAGGSVLVTASRRTPEPARAILAERLAALPGTVWDGQGPNPYFA